MWVEHSQLIDLQSVLCLLDVSVSELVLGVSRKIIEIFPAELKHSSSFGSE